MLGLCAHKNSFVGSDWDVDWEEQRQSWGEPWSPRYQGAPGGDFSSQQGRGEGESVEHQWEVAGARGGCQGCETTSIPTLLNILFAGFISVVLRGISHRVTALGSDGVLKQLRQN